MLLICARSGCLDGFRSVVPYYVWSVVLIIYIFVVPNYSIFVVPTILRL